MITALELVESKFPNHNGVFVLRNIEEFMIEFAKMHRKAILTKIYGGMDEMFEFEVIGFIEDTYPESNIK